VQIRCITRLGNAAFQSEADTQEEPKKQPIEKATESKGPAHNPLCAVRDETATNDSIGRRGKATSSMRPHPFESV